MMLSTSKIVLALCNCSQGCKLKIWTVNAFTDKPFEGNPAAVTIVKEFPAGALCQKLAAEMSLPAMAFLKPLGINHFHIRWFNPGSEARLCGHATLASSHILFQEGIVTGKRITFDSFTGPLFVRREKNEIILDFPLQRTGNTLSTHLFKDLFNEGFVQAVQAYDDVIVELTDEILIRELTLNLSKVKNIECRSFIVTARGNAPYDFISRVFAPRLGVDEDPVCGSAHVKLADYWQKKQGKDRFLAYQASARGGVLDITIVGERVYLKGKAVTIMEGMLRITTDRLTGKINELTY